jgi:hypothetical protein
MDCRLDKVPADLMTEGTVQNGEMPALTNAGTLFYRPMFKAARISPTELQATMAAVTSRYLVSRESGGIQIAGVGDQGEQVAVNPHGRSQGVPSALPAHPCQQGSLWQPRGF